MSDLLAELRVQITGDTKQFDNSLKQTENKTKKAQASLKKFGSNMSKIAAVGIAAVGTASIKFASDLGESVNAVNVVFGDSADIIKNWGDVAAEQAGLSKSAFNESSALIGTLLKKTGKDFDNVAEDTIEVTKRAADLASVFNKDLSVATNAVGAALRGETEPIRQFAIDVSAAAVEAEALSSGLIDNKKELTEAIKVQARYNLILKQSQNVAGDFQNTNNELANSSRVLKAEIENAGAELGEAFLPVAKEIVVFVRDAVKGFSGLEKGTKNLVLGLAGAVAVLPPAIAGIKALGVAMAGAGGSITLISVAITGIIAGLTVLKEQELKKLKNEFGDVADEVGRTAKEVKDIGQDFAVLNMENADRLNMFQKEQENITKLQKQHGLTRIELLKILAVTEHISEEQRARFIKEVESFERLAELRKKKELDEKEAAELARLQAEQEAERRKQLEEAEAIRLANEIAIKEENLLKKEEIDQSYQDKLLQQSEDRLAILQSEKEAELAQAEEVGADKQAILQYYAVEEDNLKEQLKDEEIKRQEEITATIKAENKKRLDAITKSIDQVLSIGAGLHQIELNNHKAETQSKIDALDKKTLGEEKYQDKVDEINKEAAIKEWEIQKKMHESEKAAAMIQAGINIAQGVTMALASAPPPFNFALAGLTAAAGAVQIGVISSQPEPPRPQLNSGAIVQGSTAGIPVTVGENSYPELIMSTAPKGDALLSEFADKVNEKGGSQGITFIQQSTFNLQNDNEIEEAAEKLYDALEQTKIRRGAV